MRDCAAARVVRRASPGFGPFALAGVASTGHHGSSLTGAAPAGGKGEAGGVTAVVFSRDFAGEFSGNVEERKEAPLALKLDFGFGVEEGGRGWRSGLGGRRWRGAGCVASHRGARLSFRTDNAVYASC